MTNKDKYLKEGISGNDIFNLSQALGEYLTIKCRAKNVFVSDINTFFALKLETTPTLTEDERVILEFIKNFDYIGRDKKGLYYKLQDEDIKEKTAVIYNFTTSLFQFIKEGEEYSIEELLKE